MRWIGWVPEGQNGEVSIVVNRPADNHRPSTTAFTVLRVFLGVVLLLAAALKAHQAVTEPLKFTILGGSSVPVLAQVAFEVLLGLWLLTGWYPKAARWVSTACFAIFFTVVTYKAISGETTCGCFGNIPVNPWITMGFDFVVVATLLQVRPVPGAFRLRPVYGIPAVAVCVSLVGIGAVSWNRPVILSENDEIRANQVVVLKPETWLGKRLPLYRYIDHGEELTKGQWLLVLYSNTCPECASAMPRLERLGSELMFQPGLPQLVFIEMTPYAPAGTAGDEVLTTAPIVRLAGSQQWIAQTPAMIAVDDGRVVAAFNREETLQVLQANSYADRIKACFIR